MEKLKSLNENKTIATIPVIDAEEMIYSVEPREYFATCVQIGVIYKIKRKIPFQSEGEYTDYALTETIDGETFIFRIVKSFGYGEGVYSIDFISENYRYALMEFEREGLDKLEETVISFIKTILESDHDIQLLRFSGAPSSYSKSDVDNARNLLQKADYQGYRDINELKPDEIRDELYRAGIKNTDLQNSINNHSHKRDTVFAYRLNKLFSKYKLPYTARKDQNFSDVFIERVNGSAS